MSNAARIALIVAALAVAVVAFVLVSPGGDDADDDRAAVTATTPATGPVETATETVPEPEQTRIQMRGGEVVGGPKTVEVESGDRVRIVITSDTPDELHLHGYDITRRAAPGRPGRFAFTADAEGEFELESHEAEEKGLEALVARVVVSPS